MKKSILLIIFCFATLFSYGQEVYDFETEATSLYFQNFSSTLEGVLTSVIDNPDQSGINESSKVGELIKPANSQPWAGGFSNPNPANGVDATNGGQICIDVWLDEPGSFAMKLEGSSTADNWEVSKVATTSGMWEQICYSFDEPSDVGGHPATGNMFTTIVIFRDLGTAHETDKVTYFDNISIEPANSGPVTTVILDFETEGKNTDFQHFGSTLDPMVFSAIANPDQSGINVSDSVFALVKPAMAQSWAGAFSNPNPETLIDASNGGQICIDVWMDHIGNITLKLEGEQNGGPNWILSGENTTMNQWETVCLDFSEASIEDPFTPATGGVYSTVVMFADFMQVGGEEDVTTYVDNIVVQSSSVAVEGNVKFAVDMNGYAGSFTNVYVSGTFNDWSGNSNQLLDDDGDGVYEMTIPLPIGTYEYKFTLDDWNEQEMLARTSTCTISTDDGSGNIFTNRSLSVTGDADLPNVCFNSCYACGDAVNITFNLGVNNPDPTGVWLAGGAEFGAPGGNYQMSDDDGDGVFTISLERANGWEGYYTFTNGNCPDFSCKENIAGQDCARPENFNDRYLDPATEDTEINTCFGECTTDTNCTGGPGMTMTTFTVDMSEVSEVHPEGVRIAGQFSSWADVLMTDDDGDNVWSVTIELLATTYEYKFKNGPEGWEEFAGGEECTMTTPDGEFTNRVIDLEGAGDTSESGLFCFESCEACIVSTNDVAIDNSLISIMPTVTSDQLLVTSKVNFENNSKLIIYSLDGAMDRTVILTPNTNSQMIDVNHLAKGIYFISLNTESTISTQRFIKI